MIQKKLSSQQVVSTAKNIALKVIQQICSCKHFNGDHLMILIKDYSDNPKVQKEAYNQCRRALVKLGYIGRECQTAD